MFRIVIRKELLENIQNFRFLVALLVGIVLIPLSFAINVREFTLKDANFRESVRLYEESRDTLGNMYRDGLSFDFVSIAPGLKSRKWHGEHFG